MLEKFYSDSLDLDDENLENSKPDDQAKSLYSKMQTELVNMQNRITEINAASKKRKDLLANTKDIKAIFKDLGKDD
jgi:hypothetical protein